MLSVYVCVCASVYCEVEARIKPTIYHRESAFMKNAYPTISRSSARAIILTSNFTDLIKTFFFLSRILSIQCNTYIDIETLTSMKMTINPAWKVSKSSTPKPPFLAHRFL